MSKKNLTVSIKKGVNILGQFNHLRRVFKKIRICFNKTKIIRKTKAIPKTLRLGKTEGQNRLISKQSNKYKVAIL
jgi:hypothetical protein